MARRGLAFTFQHLLAQLVFLTLSVSNRYQTTRVGTRRKFSTPISVVILRILLE